MISNAKPQNIIIVATVIVAMVSGLGLINSATYYSGTYVMIRNLRVTLEDVRVNNFQPNNYTNNPILSFEFNVYVPEGPPGDAQITYFSAAVYINGNQMSYTSFRKDVTPAELRYLHPGYNETYVIGSSVSENLDKALLYGAYNSSDWVFSITLTVFYHAFDAVGEEVRPIAFSWDKPPSGLSS
jgi:hypothetical protein